MWLLVVEAMIAVGLLLFIVWWTLAPAQRREREELERLARASLLPAAASDDDAAQCNDLGTANENSGIAASKRVPSSATTK